MRQRALMSIGQGLNKTKAAIFDGTNDQLTAGPTHSNSKLVTYVMWIAIGGSATAQQFIYDTNKFQVLRLPSGVGPESQKLNFIGINSAATNIMVLYSSGVFTSATWQCVMFSANLGTATRHLYIGDTDSLGTVDTFTDDTMGTHGASGIGPSASSDLAADMALIWCTFGTAIDFSVEANRRLFYSATGKWVDLGAQGEKPLGSPPEVFCRVPYRDNNPSVFAMNRGSLGGSYTITGTLGLASTSPSD